MHDSIDNYNVQYKEIKGMDETYYITVDGRVWTNSRKNGIERFMKSHMTKDGYISIGLKENGKQKQFRVHRLVAQAFIPNPENKPYINHIDGDRTNNNISNLEWCTQKENVRHSINVLKHWSQSEKQSEASRKTGKMNRKLDFETAEKIRKEYRCGGISSIKLSQKYNLSKPCILRIIHNKSYKEV